MTVLNAIMMSGREVLPLIEGGKGVAVTTGLCSGAWAATGAIGTVSGVNADSYDENGNILPQIYYGKTRRERFEELIAFAIKGGLAQLQRAHDVSNGEGRLHMNVLWEMGGAERILHGILEQAKGMLHGVTCGAGMPYRVSEITSHYGVYYYPIVSSARAFRALWLRAFHKFQDFLGGVVYEDPWLAGGHNGLSNAENPLQPENPFPRVLALRKLMREYGLDNVPIIMAGGVWCLNEWKDWINNPDLGPIGFQFGTRPLLTKESPVANAWKKILLSLKKGDIALHRFSPTGFFSSAVRNTFINELFQRSEHQIAYAAEKTEDRTESYQINPVGNPVFISAEDAKKIGEWNASGFTKPLRTPAGTLIFVTPEKAKEIKDDQASCMGCLSGCQFSNWSQGETGSTGLMADPRSFCIQKTLQNVAHGGDPDKNLMFAGHNGYRFATDPFYANGFIPTVKQLVERIQTGD